MKRPLLALVLASAGVVHAATDKRFTCEPKTVSKSGTVKLTFGRSHPEELAVVAPDGSYFFIARRRLANEPQPVGIPHKVFAGIMDLTLDLRSFEAARAQVGAPETERVFASPGRYRFLLSDRLESEEVDRVQSCEIRVQDP